MEIEFERKAYEHMLGRKHTKEPNYALFLKGARRVGKSTLAEMFGERECKSPFDWLDEAMIVNIAERVAEPSAAFNLSTIDPCFKCYTMDMGLLVSLTCKSKSHLDNELYREILFDKLHVNEAIGHKWSEDLSSCIAFKEAFSKMRHRNQR